MNNPQTQIQDSTVNFKHNRESLQNLKKLCRKTSFINCPCQQVWECEDAGLYSRLAPCSFTNKSIDNILKNIEVNNG